jgi:hypothetical protein
MISALKGHKQQHGATPYGLSSGAGKSPEGAKASPRKLRLIPHPKRLFCGNPFFSSRNLFVFISSKNQKEKN